MDEFLKKQLWGNSAEAWLMAFAVVLGGLVGLLLLKRIVIRRLKSWSAHTKTTIDDFLIANISRSLLPLGYCALVYSASKTLRLTPRIANIIHVAFLFLLSFFLLRLLTSLVRHLIFSFINHKENGEAKAKQARGLLLILNAVIWLLGFIFLIDNLGYDVTTLVAGLGIGGIAIALAAQTILGDLFSYFVIFFDRPFEVGDFIIIDDKMGVVEYVGIKTTRLRTLNGEQLVCSNTFLTNARVHNYKRMQERRVVFKLGVVYQTPPDVLESIPVMVRQIIENREGIRFDRAHLASFGAYSIDFEFVYYVLSPEYNTYMDIQQGILLGIARKFDAERIEFAYPTQAIFIQPSAGVAPTNGLQPHASQMH